MPVKAQTFDISKFYKPSEKQKKFHSSTAKYRLYGGAKGGGKTAALVWEAISTCLRIPKCNVLILRRTFPQLDAGALSYFIKFVPPELYGGRKNFNQSKYVCRFPNGSVLWFRPCQNEDDVYDYQGHEYVAILIDESTEFTYTMFDFLRKQLRYTYQQKDIYGNDIIKFMCLATNPGGVGHKWHKCLFVDHIPYDEMDAQAVAKFDKTQFEFIQSLPTDNPYLDQETLNNLQNANEADYQRYFLGSWDVFSGQYFQRWSKQISVIPAWIAEGLVQKQHWQPRWIGIDRGYGDHSCALWASHVDYCTPDGISKPVVLIYRELLRKEMGERDWAEEVAKHCVYETSMGPKRESIDAIYLSHDSFEKRSEHTVAEMINDGWAKWGLPPAVPADKDRVSGWRFLDELMAPRPLPDLLISDACVEVINAIPLAMRDEKVDGNVKLSRTKTEDVLDALRYTCKSRMEQIKTPRNVMKAEALSHCTNGNQALFTALMFEQQNRNKSLGIRLRRRRWPSSTF